MTQSIRKADLSSGLESQKPFLLPVTGGSVPLKFTQGSNSSNLLITFHGRIDREKRKPPVYVYPPKLGSGAPDTISIADPTMMLDADFAMSWYAGHEGFATQSVLVEVIRQIAELRGSRRLVFMGGSGGGFASLYYSWHFPGSTALVSAPQTNIARYPANHVRRFVSGAWPDADGIQALEGRICTNVCPLYAEGYRNTVIYLQSIGDRSHFSAHMAPFVAAIASAPEDRVILDCQHWGGWGHAPLVIPHEVIINWLRAILASKDQEVKTLLETYTALASTAPDTSSHQVAEAEPLAANFNERDLQRADLLAKSILKV